MNDFLKFIQSINKYNNLVKQLTSSKEGHIYIGNCATNLSKIISSLLYLNSDKSIVYVTENIYEASKAYEVFCDLLSLDEVSFFPQEEFISSELVASSKTFKLARMQALHNIVNNKKQLIVTCSEGITKRTMSRQRIIDSTLSINVGDTYPIRKLVNDLISRGYKKTPTTYEIGSLSVRGSLVDIYPINSNDIYRISYFDDEIETIKIVDNETQMSKEKVSSIEVFPLFEMYYSLDEVNTIVNRIKDEVPMSKKVEHDIEKIIDYDSLDQLYIYLPFIDSNYSSFLELLDNPICIYEDLSRILDHEDAQTKEISEYFLAVKYSSKNDFFKSIKQCLGYSNYNIYTSNSISSLNDIRLTKLIDLHTVNCFDYNNNIKTVIEDIKVTKDRTCIVTHFDESKVKFLCEVFSNHNLVYIINSLHDINSYTSNEVNLIICPSSYGFIDLELNLEILTPNEFAPGKINKSSKYQKYYKNTTKIYSKDDIKPGDYIVHQDYGIGIYGGIESRNIRGNINDYVKIIFAEESSLLVPIENIYLLEKYNSSKDLLPKLNKIDGKEWKKKKAKVTERVYEVAKRLIKVQAEREVKKGFVYEKDTDEQIKFESDFDYNETIDQLQAINDVKADMESSKPVDRLVCGDVGFGKTEVAMRAAFKACENGKQVAYLAPTTVLTRQHYYTFKERFEKYGVRVELLNRFVSKKDQEKTIEGLRKGYVDIVIGTHRLLSNDIIFKDLGLLIIDEEQRFGVSHKEKIKEMKANVDVLTLTATPIPRTLQMSLSGLRDLSLIETPPTNRLPIQTYVLEANDSVIREAINREIGRGGQVFYLLNRIEKLDMLIAKIHRLNPYAKVGMIHGKMNKDDIESQLISFLDREFDVLVCTSIIETGIDIPNANTLIIEDSDHLGLGQLYQIRGRVGRSDRISYAYLMYDAHKVITDTARKRLDAIKEFTALGSGYKIAMRDLAIRGAGDILGDEQSGFIDAIGMDLYMKLLNEAINDVKGIKEENEVAHYNININRHIEKEYVEDEEIIISIHKEICKIRSREQINNLISEYTDRYGKLSSSVLLYMEGKYLEFLLKSRGVERINETDKEVIITLDNDALKRIDIDSLKQVLNENISTTSVRLLNDKLNICINLSSYSIKQNYIYDLTKSLEKVKLARL